MLKVRDMFWDKKQWDKNKKNKSNKSWQDVVAKSVGAIVLAVETDRRLNNRREAMKYAVEFHKYDGKSKSIDTTIEHAQLILNWINRSD